MFTLQIKTLSNWTTYASFQNVNDACRACEKLVNSEQSSCRVVEKYESSGLNIIMERFYIRRIDPNASWYDEDLPSEPVNWIRDGF